MGISPIQLLIVLLIVVLVFGGKRLRSLGSDLGEAIKGFKQATKSDELPPQTQARVDHHADDRVIDGKVTQKEESR